MVDCIAGYHLNPWTCGIAKFNTILSRHLAVPVVGIRAVELGNHANPLLSLKLNEFADADAALAKKDLGTYAAKVEAARSLVQQAVDALDAAKP